MTALASILFFPMTHRLAHHTKSCAQPSHSRPCFVRRCSHKSTKSLASASPQLETPSSNKALTLGVGGQRPLHPLRPAADLHTCVSGGSQVFASGCVISKQCSKKLLEGIALHLGFLLWPGLLVKSFQHNFTLGKVATRTHTMKTTSSPGLPVCCCTPSQESSVP